MNLNRSIHDKKLIDISKVKALLFLWKKYFFLLESEIIIGILGRIYINILLFNNLSKIILPISCLILPISCLILPISCLILPILIFPVFGLPKKFLKFFLKIPKKFLFLGTHNNLKNKRFLAILPKFLKFLKNLCTNKFFISSWQPSIILEWHLFKNRKFAL